MKGPTPGTSVHASPILERLGRKQEAGAFRVEGVTGPCQLSPQGLAGEGEQEPLGKEGGDEKRALPAAKFRSALRRLPVCAERRPRGTQSSPSP